MALDKARVKIGLEMIPTILPIHDPEDLKQMSDILGGIPWGKVAFALAADIYNATERHPDGWATFDDYLEFLLQTVMYMRGKRDKFPDAIADEPEIAELFTNRLEVIKRAFSKRAKAEAKK